MIKRFLPLLLIPAVLILYWKTLDNPLIFDDAYSLNLFYYFTKQFNQHPTSFLMTLWDFLKVFLTEPDRYIAYISFDLIESLSSDFFWQRLLNIILHISNSLLIYILIFQLFKNRKTALFSCLFFALNPASIHAVAYLVQRNVLFMLFFGLLQCILYLRAIESKSEIKAATFFVLSLICFTLCKFYKEQGLMFALMYPLLSIGSTSKRFIL